MPEQLPEELSREKVPGALSKAPNINGSAPPRVRTKLGGAGDRFGGFLFAEYNHVPCASRLSGI